MVAGSVGTRSRMGVQYICASSGEVEVMGKTTSLPRVGAAREGYHLSPKVADPGFEVDPCNPSVTGPEGRTGTGSPVGGWGDRF